MDYFARPELTVYNAIPTAEGCIGILLAERTRTLWGTNLLLLGFGPVGQALGVRLAALGMNVTVCARRAEQRMVTAQAVTDARLEELTREVRAHNNFAQRVPVLEEQLRVANHRLSNLEKAHTPAGRAIS